jgi:fengycin family lipopeptide synthetase E
MNSYIDEKRYWLNKLGKCTIGGEVPYDYKGTLNKKCYCTKSSDMNKLDIEKIQKVSADSIQGIFVILATGVSYVLHSYHMTDEIVIGVPNSESINKQSLIVPAVIKIDDNSDYVNFLSQVQIEFADCIKFGNSFESINDKKDNTKICIYMKGLHNISQETLNDYSMQVEFEWKQQKLYCNVYYNQRLYQEITIERFIDNVVKFINEAVNSPYITLNEINILSEQDREDIIYNFNNTKNDTYPVHMTIQQVFENQVAKNPNKIAIVYNETRLTYEQFNRKANQLANVLIRMGVQRNEVIPVRIIKSLDMMIGIMAVLKAGAAYLPIDIN